MSFLENRRPAGSDDVARLEAAVGVLPDDYRRFLLASDGADASPNEVQLAGLEGMADVQSLYSIAETLAARTALRGRVGRDELPIGSSAGGNEWLLSTAVASLGAVSFFDHETDVAVRAFETFTGFVESLVEPAPLEFDPNRFVVRDLDPDFDAEQRRLGNIDE